MHAELDLPPETRPARIAWGISLALHILLLVLVFEKTLPAAVERPLIHLTLKPAQQAPQKNIAFDVAKSKTQSEPVSPFREKTSDKDKLHSEINPLLPEAVDVKLQLEYSITDSNKVTENSLEEVQQDRGGTIFDPRLRRALNRNEISVPHNVEHWQSSGQHFYRLGANECLREKVGGYGIENRHSEEFLLFNVRKVECAPQGDEGAQIIQAVKTALAAK